MIFSVCFSFRYSTCCGNGWMFWMLLYLQGFSFPFAMDLPLVGFLLSNFLSYCYQKKCCVLDYFSRKLGYANHLHKFVKW